MDFKFSAKNFDSEYNIYVLGRYAYIEASDTYKSRRRLGDTARLVSPVLRIPRTCFRIWYHMYGRAMGSINVFLKPENRPEKVLWQRKGNQGNVWKLAEMTVESIYPYQVR